MRINRLNDLYKSLKEFIEKVRTYGCASTYKWLRSYVEVIGRIHTGGCEDVYVWGGRFLDLQERLRCTRLLSA